MKKRKTFHHENNAQWASFLSQMGKWILDLGLEILEPIYHDEEVYVQ